MLQRYDGQPIPSNRSTFELLPAVDLRAGRVVRLVRGDFGSETAYDVRPGDAAGNFADAGVHSLHVVDLDGAVEGRVVNGEAIGRIIAAAGDRMRVEVAGGLRSEEAVATALRLGAARAVLGTAALQDPALVRRLIARFGVEAVVVALDVRDGLAVGHGWGPGAPGVPVTEALTRLADEGAALFEVTAIDRDGTFAGPDLGLLEGLVRLGRGGIIASAGISSGDDIRAVRAIGCVGAIVGRALYEGRLTIEDALAAAG